MMKGYRRWLLHVLMLLIASAAAGCISDPVVTGTTPATGDSVHGVLVVNEGLLRQDNSTLTFYDPVVGVAEQDYFALKNPGMRLGDTGNDITVRGDRAYIPVTTSQNVEVIALPSGRSSGRVRIANGGDPRQVVIVDDSTAFVSLVTGDAVVEFDPRTLAIVRRLPVGPAPEGIVPAGGRLFVANSGYGFLRQSEPKAGTISVITIADGISMQYLHPGPNPTDLHYCRATGKLYALYGMPAVDSLGGVVEYDPLTLEEKRRWPVAGAGVAGEMSFDEGGEFLYVIGTGGITRIDLQAQALHAETWYQSDQWTPLGFYSLGVAPGSGDLYVGYTKGFTIPGEVLILSRNGILKGRFPAGLNPGAIGFY
jgi:hypothetical protein